jgi:poly(A) polymerase
MNKLLKLAVIKRFGQIFAENINDFRIIGGAVRSYLLNTEIRDIDIATSLYPDELKALAEKKNIKIIDSGLKYGTQTIIIDNISLEVTTLRSDLQSNGRHAQVKYTRIWSEDAKRRDFTINAIYMDFFGKIYDYHQGIADIEAKIIRFIGNPEERITEDYLRILRLFRFYAELDQFKIDSYALTAVNKLGAKISYLSKERITQELTKISFAVNYDKALELIAASQELINVININSCAIDKIKKFRSLNNISPGYLIIISHLFTERGLNYLALSKDEQNLVKLLRKNLKLDFSSINNIKRNLFIYGRTKLELIYLKQIFINTAKLDYNIIKKIKNIDIPIFPLSGDDLKKEGFKEGKTLGTELNKRLKIWLENDFKLI